MITDVENNIQLSCTLQLLATYMNLRYKTQFLFARKSLSDLGIKIISMHFKVKSIGPRGQFGNALIHHFESYISE